MINATGNRMTREIQRQSTLAARVAETQAQISSGKRLQRASDDPVAATRVATLRQIQANDAARAGNIALGISLAGQADGVMQTASDLMAQVQELALSGANGALTAADRAVIAAELTAIADELDALSQTTAVTGEALFTPGTPNVIRFDGETIFAPVPSRAELFETGGISVGQVVRDAAIALASGNAAQIGASLTAVSGGVEQMANASASVGFIAARLDRLQESSAYRAVTVAEERSNLEDTDLSTAIAELNGHTLTLEAAQAAFARINRRTLMDFLT